MISRDCTPAPKGPKKNSFLPIGVDVSSLISLFFARFDFKSATDLLLFSIIETLL